MAIQSTTVAVPRRHHFTADEYYRMAEAGIFHEDSRMPHASASSSAPARSLQPGALTSP